MYTGQFWLSVNEAALIFATAVKKDRGGLFNEAVRSFTPGRSAAA